MIAAGLSAADAWRRTRIELGGPAQVREDVRDVWLTRWLRDFVYDLRRRAAVWLVLRDAVV